MERGQDLGAPRRARSRWGPSSPVPPTPRSRALAEFGSHVGTAFQAVDDLLGIWGEPARTGKPVGSDLVQHKKTLPVSIALARAGEDRPSCCTCSRATSRRRTWSGRGC